MKEKAAEDKLVKCACPGCGIMVKADKDDKPVYCTPQHEELANIIKGRTSNNGNSITGI